MTTDTIQLIIYLASQIITLAILIITILSRSKNKKLKDIANRSLKILEYCQDAVLFAETLTNISGSEKKQYAMERVIDLCSESGLNVSEDEVSQISSDIEKIIDLTKKINAK